MVWKETVAEGGLRLHWIGWLIVVILVLLSFLPAVYILADYFGSGYDEFTGWPRRSLVMLQWPMNAWVRTVGTTVSCLMLLAVAIRAATSISSERERQTFDGLVASPLSAGEILWGKWLGSMLSVRLAWLWLLPIWGLGVLTEGLQPLAVGLLVGAWCVYAGVLALLGLWFSLVCRTSSHAILATLGTTLAITFGHWLPWVCCAFGGMGGGGSGLADLALMQAGATPPASLALFAFAGPELFQYHHEGPKLILFPLGGLCFWFVGAFVLWGALHQRFCLVTNRDTFLVPERRVIPRPPGSPSPSAPAAAPLTQLRGATLIEDTPPPPPAPPLFQPRGAKLIEETWEPPHRPPSPPADD